MSWRKQVTGDGPAITPTPKVVDAEPPKAPKPPKAPSKPRFGKKQVEDMIEPLLETIAALETKIAELQGQSTPFDVTKILNLPYIMAKLENDNAEANEYLKDTIIIPDELKEEFSKMSKKDVRKDGRFKQRVRVRNIISNLCSFLISELQ